MRNPRLFPIPGDIVALWPIEFEVLSIHKNVQAEMSIAPSIPGKRTQYEIVEFVFPGWRRRVRGYEVKRRALRP